MITQGDICKLDEIAEKHGCELYFPPFNKTHNLFYRISNIRDNTVKFIRFISDILMADVKFELVTINNEEFLEVKNELH